MSANKLELHRDWEAKTPEIAGHFYFSGTIMLGSAALSFAPHSVQLDVTKKNDRLEATFQGRTLALSAFDGRWLGPQPEGVVWS